MDAPESSINVSGTVSTATGEGSGPSAAPPPPATGGVESPVVVAAPSLSVAASASGSSSGSSRYESQKRRDWNTFLQYLKNHKPPLTLARCSGAHVIEFLKYLDQFGKTKVHITGCSYFGNPNPPAPCACPLRQAWGSLDALIGRLRAAYEESGGRPESNPFGAKAVRIYLREVREAQAKARGIPYEKKKKKRKKPGSPSKEAGGGGGGGGSRGSDSGSGHFDTPAETASAHVAAAPPASGGSGGGDARVGPTPTAPVNVATTIPFSH